MKIIGLVGFLGSGKNAVGEILQTKYGYQPESFAKSVKDAVAVIFGWDREMLEGTTPESRTWRESTDDFWSRRLGQTMSPRYALQLMGTEAGRNVFGQDLWTLSVERRLEENGQYVITDTRFPNEMKMITQLGGVIVRVKRGEDPEWFEAATHANSDLAETGSCRFEHEDLGKVHISEWAWCGSPYISHTVHNNGSLDDLKSEVALLTLLI